MVYLLRQTIIKSILIGEVYNFLTPIYEFGKNTNSSYSVVLILCLMIVWRQSEFAFFVRQLWLAHFFY